MALDEIGMGLGGGTLLGTVLTYLGMKQRVNYRQLKQTVLPHGFYRCRRMKMKWIHRLIVGGGKQNGN